MFDSVHKTGLKLACIIFNLILKELSDFSDFENAYKKVLVFNAVHKTGLKLGLIIFILTILIDLILHNN